MDSKDSKDELLEQLSKQILPSFEEKIQGIIDKEKNYFEQLLKDGIQKADEGSFDEIIKELIARIEKREKELSQKWIKAIQEVSEPLPKLVELPQDEIRFVSTEDDSVYVWTGKAAKWLWRSVTHTSTRAGNGFRRLFNKPVRPMPKWTQEVPIKHIVEFHLLDTQQWIGQWQIFTHRLTASLLHRTDQWILKSQGVASKEEPAEKQQEQEKSEPIPENLKSLLEEQIAALDEFHRTHLEELSSVVQKAERDIFSDIEIVGTFEKDSEPYTDVRIKEKINYYLEILEDRQSGWNRLLEALRSEVLAVLNFITLKEKVEAESSELEKKIATLFSDQIGTTSQELQKEISDGIARLQYLREQSERELPALASEIRESVLQTVNNRLLQPLDEIVEEALLSVALEKFTSALADTPDFLAEKMILVSELDLGQTPPEYSLDEVNWQALVRRVLSEGLIKEFLPEKLQPEEFFIKLGKDYSDIEQTIEVNLEIVDEVSQADEESPVEVAIEALQRTHSKVEGLMNEAESKREELFSLLADCQNKALSRITRLLETQDVSEIRWVGAQYQAKETAAGWKTVFSVYYAKTADRIELLSRFIWKKTKIYYKQFGKLLGFREEKKLEEEKADLATFLSQTDEKIAQLPFIYRKLFDFSKKVDSRFYIRRPEQFDRFKKAYDLWQNDFPSTLGVIGEKGSGKSTFLKLLSEEVMTEHQIVTIKFEKTCWTESDIISAIAGGLKVDDISTADELIEKIQSKKKRIVIILEDIQNCYVRHLSGYQGIESLLYLISETNNKVLWTVSCSSYAWNFLDKVQNAGDYFTHLAQTDRLDADQIESVILKRHKASGYQLRFLADEATEKSRSYRKLMDDDTAAQQHLENQYFEKLAGMAEGNASIAIILWIRSIREYDDTHFYIEPFQTDAVQGIKDLEQPALFTFAAMVLHDTLTPQELSMVLNEPLQESKLIISQQASRSILIKGSNGYTLNQLVYRQILRELKERNLIH